MAMDNLKEQFGVGPERTFTLLRWALDINPTNYYTLMHMGELLLVIRGSFAEAERIPNNAD